MALPNLKKVAKTKRGIAAIAIAVVLFLSNGIDVIGRLQTVASLKPYLHYALILPTYGAVVGAWIGGHFSSVTGIGVSVILFAWAARDVVEQERAAPPANLILSFTTLRQVAIGDQPYNWENATFNSEDPQVALVARFANRARSVPVGVAHDVRADIIFEDAKGTHVASHPAPWLYRASPVVSFAVGAQNELLVALDVFEFPQFPPPVNVAQAQRPQAVLRPVEDIADREPNSTARYSYHRGLSGSVKAIVYLTVNGFAVPPYELALQASDRSVTPQAPPTIKAIRRATRWQKIWGATKETLRKSAPVQFEI